MIGQGADGDVPDGINFVQKLPVHPEQAPLVRKQQNLALGRLCIVTAFHRGHGGHPPGAVVLMDFPGVFLPDEHRAFADVQHMLHILLPDDLAPLEGDAFEAVVHLGDIVAQLHADGVLNLYFLHFITSFVSSFRSSSASGGRQISISSDRIVRQISLCISQPTGAAEGAACSITV